MKQASYFLFGIATRRLSRSVRHNSMCISIITRSCSSAGDNDSSDSKKFSSQGAYVTYRSGWPSLIIALPSTGENCQFSLCVVPGQTLQDLSVAIKNEDSSASAVSFYSLDGVRFSHSTTVNSLLLSSFKIKINDKEYDVSVPKLDDNIAGNLEKLGEIRLLVNNLYVALNANTNRATEEKKLVEELDKIQSEIEPLEKERQRLLRTCETRTNRLLWVGLAAMGVQAGVLGRLTWYEYSWDIMEPVTYFVTYSAVMAGFAYYVLTKQQYEYPDARQRMYLNRFYKLVRKSKFDLQKYRELKSQETGLNEQLKSLRGGKAS